MNDDIRSALDGIEPAEGAKDRMMQNILRKAAAQTEENAEESAKKTVPFKRVLRWALPAAACFLLIFAAIKLLPGLTTPKIPAEQTEAPSDLQGANPIEEADDADDLYTRTGIRLIPPENAASVRYYVNVAEGIANVDFASDGHVYTLCAAKRSDDFSGLYADTVSEEMIDEKTGALLTVLECGDETYLKITWQKEDAAYVLLNTDGAAQDELIRLYHAVK